ncbi:MAG TPA: hypothetical protein VM581_00990 [Magnetospirillaceae bacterium]|nr:hypothetical protein [Magnetospirillaceae bacterium]
MRSTQGFSLPLVVVIVGVIGVLGFIGWRMFSSGEDNKKNTATQPQNGQQSLAQTVDPNKGYFVIKEWGVRFKPVNDIGTIIYKAWPVSGIPAGDGSGISLPEGSVKIMLSTHELVALSTDCDVNQDATGVWELFRSPQSLNLSDNLSLGKVGDYYYYYFHSQAACVVNEADYPANSKVSSQLFDSFKTLELAK